jgi:hypothetical protein
MEYLKLLLAAFACGILIFWFQARDVVDNYAVAAALTALSCIFALVFWSNRTPRKP